MDKNSLSVEGQDSATDLGSELSLNVPPALGLYRESGDWGSSPCSVSCVGWPWLGLFHVLGHGPRQIALNPKWKYWEELENR